MEEQIQTSPTSSYHIAIQPMPPYRAIQPRTALVGNTCEEDQRTGSAENQELASRPNREAFPGLVRRTRIRQKRAVNRSRDRTPLQSIQPRVSASLSATGGGVYPSPQPTQQGSNSSQVSPKASAVGESANPGKARRGRPVTRTQARGRGTRAETLRDIRPKDVVSNQPIEAPAGGLLGSGVRYGTTDVVDNMGRGEIMQSQAIVLNTGAAVHRTLRPLAPRLQPVPESAIDGSESRATPVSLEAGVTNISRRPNDAFPTQLASHANPGEPSFLTLRHIACAPLQYYSTAAYYLGQK
ncbi:hypothetical protein S40285_10794 [Stachybotrys chlorohalonatus IBT 40285]|uniref:Uncharacterized protein n=1 Tax=Stachybotrys chlorohalonatus (strain IBT 40285) TaxID=1283841 RepID=A0A084QZV5_STAC4|nr:hypothetical protein S40285_10794 [Stachybotrys chlorohalonata IBT 40285]